MVATENPQVAEEKGTALTKAKKKASEKLTITAQDVTNYLCPEASTQEVALFLKTCQSEGLNPFAREIYLIKYQKDKPAQIVLSVDVFLKAAEANEQFDGFEAGIILQDTGGKLEFREGSFLLDEEKGKFRGGWAKVFRKDRSKPFYSAVTLEGYRKYTRDGHPTEFWADKKCPDMIRKVAISHAFKEAFPNRLSTLYTEAEFEEVPEGTLPSAFLKQGEPKWDKFWTKVAEIGYKDKEEVHKILGVASLKEWVDSGKTMEDAIRKLADIKANLEEFNKLSAPVSESEIPFIEDKLLQGWGVAKDAVKRLKITEEQVSKWFAHYNFARLNVPGYQIVELSLADFEKAVPPAGISNELLSRFVDSLVAYESAHKAQK